MKSKQTVAVIALFVVTALWGLTFPLIRQAVVGIGAGEFVALRFVVSIVLFSPVLFLGRAKITRALIVAGFIFGTLEALCYFSQTMGLKTIAAAQSAFITSLSVVIAPLMAPLFGLGRPRYCDILASLWCLFGVFILTGGSLWHLDIGIAWTLACAFFYALSVNYLSYVTQTIEATALFVAIQVVMGLPIPLMVWAFQAHVNPVHSAWSQIAYIALFFCAVTTLITYYLQTKYQKYLKVTHFMIIYAFEPIFASIFASLISHELITWTTAIGGGVILSSFFISQWPLPGRRKLKGL